mmetsp:Transcript_96660/g.211352  ORF Transcript_96660/g.211352 Transcript_96660/m.211352 type:complete len:345 (+) Transcript_96660:92-1126(+)
MGKKGAVEPPPVEEAPPPEEPEVPPQYLEGTFTWPDGTEFSGDYVKTKDQVIMHGEGKLTMGPESFQGTFENGMYRQGIFNGADGSIYKGCFDNNVFQGPGEYSWADGRKYIGMWEDGLMHGRGSFQNFSFGIDRIFEGFCFRGDFTSSEEGQEKAKKAFLEEYATNYRKRALETLKEIATKSIPPEPVDTKPKKGAPIELPPAEIPKEYLILPQEGPDGELGPIDEELLSVLEGPFFDGAGIESAVLTKFAGAFAEGADPAGTIKVLDTQTGSVVGGSSFLASRLKKEQLKHVGQAVSFESNDPTPGAILCAILVNTTLGSYSVAKAAWKLVHLEYVQESPPA